MFGGCRRCCMQSFLALNVVAVLPSMLTWGWLSRKQIEVPQAPFSETLPDNASADGPDTSADNPYVIESDLRPLVAGGLRFFRSGLFKEAWEYLIKQYFHHALRIVIRDGVMHFESPTLESSHALVMIFFKMHCYLGGLPDVDIIINTGDWGVVKKPLALPIWSWTKDPDMHNDLLMPYWSVTWLERIAAKKEQLASSTPWEDRVSRLIWRGSQTGFAYPSVEKWWETWSSWEWQTAPRSRLVLACRNISHVCDAGFHQVMPGVSGDVAQEMRNEGLMKEPVDASQVMPRPKYSLLIDGNGPPSSRAAEEFGDGRATFWVQGFGIEFWYNSLRPYAHFVPVKPDVSDILQQLDWAMKHDSEMQAIAKRSREFAERFLRDPALSNAFRDKIIAFAKLQSERPEIGGASKVKIHWERARFLHAYVYENARSFNLGDDVLNNGAVCLDGYVA
eukprot:TRINITY_DN9350_c0_g1_i3.p1 TRINITY_DN9350_c0_g1~~TRINITY_DN9350_c0_g1_i3.p1  ORF type:complete len:449 (-),score=50.53 TRINITY_DN9350_c0_g1_i3:392-1738(-)